MIVLQKAVTFTPCRGCSVASLPQELKGFVRHSQYDTRTMKTAAVLTAILGSAAAFVPAQVSETKTALNAFEQELGVLAPGMHQRHRGRGYKRGRGRETEEVGGADAPAVAACRWLQSRTTTAHSGTTPWRSCLTAAATRCPRRWAMTCRTASCVEWVP